MIIRRLKARTALLTVILALPFGVYAMESAERERLYDNARGFLQRNNPDAAYQALSVHEFALAGRDGFDYLLGVAALDSGRAGEAIFSFQRLLARKPDFAGARLDLARAYYDVGDYELARIEFERIMAESPPPQVVTTVNRYLAAIDSEGKVGGGPFTQTYIDFKAGYDSNAPAATDEELFLNFRLDSRNLEQASAFSMLTLGALHSRPVNDDSQFVFNARLDHRANPSTHFVDASNLDLGAGWNWSNDKQSLFLGANTLFTALDREYQKRDIALTAYYTNLVSSTWQLTSFLRGADVQFDQPGLSIRDVEHVMFGLGTNHMLASAQISLTATAMADDAKEAGSPFSSDGYGVQFKTVMFGESGRSYTVDVNAVSTSFDEPFFGVIREDDVYVVGIGMNWQGFPARSWASSINVNYSKKESTVSLYEFDRYEIGVSFRRIFN